MEKDLIRRLTAILAADVVAYSRMMNEDEAGTLGALRQLREEVVVPSVVSHRGTIVKSLGDGWLAAFTSSTDAVRSAIKIQDSLSEDAAMRLRIGVHIGDVIHEEGDVYGDGVNVAARLEGLAAPSGIAISHAVQSSLDGTLRSEFKDAGGQQLKNIADPVRVWTRGGTTISPSADTERLGTTATVASVAIVAFETLGQDASHGLLAEGITEDLAIQLARFRWLTVVANRSDGDSRYVVGGSVRGIGHRIRISAHLTYAEDGRRLWSERWERDASDLFAVQDEIAQIIVAHICPEIDAQEKTLLRARPVGSLSASELSVRANQILSTGRIDRYEEAEKLTAKAIAMDPESALPYIQKSMVGYLKAISGAWPPRETGLAALETARSAVALEPRLASTHVMVAVIYGVLGETDRALDATARVEALNPNAWGAPHGRTVAYSFAPPDWVSDRVSHAETMLECAVKTLNLAPGTAFHSGHLFFVGLGLLMKDENVDLENAIAALDRSATEPGASWWASFFIALAELRRERVDTARVRLREAQSVFPALTMTAAEELFANSHVGQSWQNEFARLAELGLPRGAS